MAEIVITYSISLTFYERKPFRRVREREKKTIPTMVGSVWFGFNSLVSWFLRFTMGKVCLLFSAAVATAEAEHAHNSNGEPMFYTFVF